MNYDIMEHLTLYKNKNMNDLILYKKYNNVEKLILELSIVTYKLYNICPKVYSKYYNDKITIIWYHPTTHNRLLHAVATTWIYHEKKWFNKKYKTGFCITLNPTDVQNI